MSKPLGGVTNMVMDEDGNVHSRQTEPDWFDMEGRANLLPYQKKKGETSFALPGILAGMGNAVQDAGRAVRGQHVPDDRAAQVGMAAMTGSLIPSKGAALFKRPVPGELNSLIGEKQWAEAAKRGVPEAQEAMGKFVEASRLLSMKIPPHKIEEQTGWIYKAGHWLREVSDAGARLLRPFPGRNHTSGSFDQDLAKADSFRTYYSNPAVEKIAPAYGEVPVLPHTESGFGGLYGNRTAGIAPKGYISVKNSLGSTAHPDYDVVHGLEGTILHEGQHALQDLAGRLPAVGSASSGKTGAHYKLIPGELEANVVQQRRLFTPEDMKKLPYTHHEKNFLDMLQEIIAGKRPDDDQWISNAQIQDVIDYLRAPK